MSKQWRMVVSAAALAVAVLMTGGCSSASKVTCDQFAAMFSAKQTTLVDMIQEHGFNPNSSIWGSAALGVTVQKYCGVSNLFGPGTATQHSSSPIENAIDWSSVGK